MSVGLMGIFMIVAAYRAEWQIPILTYCAGEKAFIVYLVAVNGSRSYARGLWLGAGMYATVLLYIIAYVAVCGFRTYPTNQTLPVAKVAH